jgi:hypothetical protein
MNSHQKKKKTLLLEKAMVLASFPKWNEKISIGEMKDHLFVSVKLVNGEGMVNYYLCAFGNKQKMTGRDHVNKQWYEFSVQIDNDIQEFLKFFSIDMPVVVDNFEFAPSKDFVPLINLEDKE